MFRRLKKRIYEDQGFTLIELLVVIMIIGILAAIAIPAFLSQKNKANDASAKELAHASETAAETYSTDHNGEYTEMSTTQLNEYEKAIILCGTATAASLSNACLKAATPTESNKGYTVETESTTGDTFTVTRFATGIVSRTCKLASGVNKGGCPTGSW